MGAKRNRWWFALAWLLVVPLPSKAAAEVHAASNISAPATGLRVSVDARGLYAITAQDPAWVFGGEIGHPLLHLLTDTGSDRIGPYTEITFTYRSASSIRAAIRLYAARPVVLFTQQYLAPASSVVPFPVLTTYPRGLSHVSYSGSFAIYSFQALSSDSPWLFFNARDDAFLLSPAANFLVAHTTQGRGGALAAGIDPAIRQLPRGFSQQTLLVIGKGINAVFDTWGRTMTDLQGTARTPSDAGSELRYLGYWTDTGAAYYYAYDRSRGYEGTLLAVRRAFQRLHIPLGYLELDSWWYPKGSAATWQGSGFLRGGIYRYAAAPALFPDGLAGFQQRLGLPLIVHARWVDPSSPYRLDYRMSGNVVTDPRYWQRIAAYLHTAGVIAYEQDWLGRFAHTATNLTDPVAFLDNMAAAMRAQGINLLYCMPLARDLLQSTRYDNVLGVRVSNDHFTPAQWTSALYDSRLAGALGIWPWDDVFQSAETDELLLATLSAGIVGVGDPIGVLDAANLRKVMRGDGVLVKPDQPMVPTDATYLADAQRIDEPMVAFTSSDHGAASTFYVFAYRRGRATQAAFQPSALGIPGRAYVYQYFTGQGRVVEQGATFRDTVQDGSYYIAVPIGRSGMALLGDLARFVAMGRQRIARFSDDGRIRVAITFGRGETSIELSGYAPLPPTIAARTGRAGAVSYSRSTQRFRVLVSPAGNGSAILEIAEPTTAANR